MTIRDYIVAYNETFRYVEERFGSAALKDMFSAISDQWCVHLDECVRRGGIGGCMEYWGGGENGGTLGREKAACTISIKDGVFSIEMNECPSVKELRERGKEPYAGKTTYCDHCRALYAPVLGRYGLSFDVDIRYGEDGSCTGKCLTTVSKMKQI